MSSAQSIGKNGFRASCSGRIGRGVYFWVFPEGGNGEAFGTSLAEVWYEWVNTKTSRFHGERDRSCAVILVTLLLEDAFALDFDDPEVAANFFEFYEANKHRFDGLSDIEKSNIRDEFVALMEEEGNAEYDVILGVVEIPVAGLDNTHIARVLHRSKCASVRNNDVISIDDIRCLAI